MVETIYFLLTLVFDEANLVPALKIAGWTFNCAFLLTVALVVLKDKLLWGFYYGFRCRRSLWACRFMAETYYFTDKLLESLTPACALGSYEDGNKYNRAVALNPLHLSGRLASAPARLLRPTPFKVVLVLLMLTWYEPLWPGKVFDLAAPLIYPAFSELSRFEVADYIGYWKELLAALLSLLGGTTFALYKANWKRKETKIERAADLRDALFRELREIRRAARHNIDQLQKMSKDVRHYLPERPRKDRRPSLPRACLGIPETAGGRFAAHFRSFSAHVEKACEVLRAVEAENLEGEYFEINRADYDKVLHLGLYSADAAKRLAGELLDAGHLQELFDAWFESPAFGERKDLEAEVQRRLREQLAEAIYNEMLLSRLLDKGGRPGLLRRAVYRVATIGS